VPGNPAAVSAATTWSIQLSPTTLTQGVARDVTVTVTSGNKELGCVALDVPAGFTVLSTRVSSVPAGLVWGSAGAGSGPTQITFSTTKDGWRLKTGAQGVFVVRVTATAGPLAAWTATAYQKFTVDPAWLVSGPLVPPGPFTIVPTPTPTPTPTLPPGVTPSPSDSASPGTTSSPSPSQSTAPSESPGAFASTGPIPGGGGQRDPGNSGGQTAGGGDGTPLDVLALPDGGAVQLDSQAVGALGMFAWLVPGLFLSLPGLLLILIVLIQAGGGTVFVPITRRVLGRERRRRD
jgi:hypothetical protein